MSGTRIYCDLELWAGASIALPHQAATHVARVLRLGPGGALELFNGRDGRNYPARILASSTAREVRVGIEAPGPEEPVPPLRIHLALGVSRGERMDMALQKATELGVAGFQPLFTERAQVHIAGDRLERRMLHWQGVLQAACEQSGRRRIPMLAPPVALSDWLERRAPFPLLILDPQAARPLPAMDPPRGELGVLVGPEGGLSAAECAEAVARGGTGVRLGPRILRTETAPLAAIAAIQVLWGDMRE
jgi:16S rRNA (uracil1498-N3)-methyltransferase